MWTVWPVDVTRVMEDSNWWCRAEAWGKRGTRIRLRHRRDFFLYLLRTPEGNYHMNTEEEVILIGVSRPLFPARVRPPGLSVSRETHPTMEERVQNALDSGTWELRYDDFGASVATGKDWYRIFAEYARFLFWSKGAADYMLELHKYSCYIVPVTRWALCEDLVRSPDPQAAWVYGCVDKLLQGGAGRSTRMELEIMPAPTARPAAAVSSPRSQTEQQSEAEASTGAFDLGRDFLSNAAPPQVITPSEWLGPHGSDCSDLGGTRAVCSG